MGFASVTLPVKVNTKFWFVAKSKVTLPVFDVSVKVFPAKFTVASFPAVTALLAIFAVVTFASVIFAVVTALSASFAVVTPPSATSAATTAPGAIFAEVIALS